MKKLWIIPVLAFLFLAYGHEIIFKKDQSGNISYTEGNVGIGTADSDSQLTVNAGAHIGQDLLVDGKVTATGGMTINANMPYSLLIDRTANANVDTYFGFNVTSSGGAGDDFISMGPYNQNALVVKDGNKVGVNTTTPDSSFTVNLGAHIQRDLLVDGKITATGDVEITGTVSATAGFSYGTQREVTLVDNVASISSPGYWKIDTEGGAALDTLDTILGTGGYTPKIGDHLIISLVNSDHDIMVDHQAAGVTTGQVLNPVGERTLSQIFSIFELICYVETKWAVITH